MRHTSIYIGDDIDKYIQKYAQEKSVKPTTAMRELLELGIKIHKHYDELGISDVFGGKDSIPFYEKKHLDYSIKTYYLLKEMFNAMSLKDNSDLIDSANKTAKKSLEEIV